jgi:hypothetical protein
MNRLAKPLFPAYSDPMKTKLLLLFTILSGSVLPVPAVELDLRTGITSRGGEWTYQIGRTFTENGRSESLPFPISELEWPLASGGLGLDLTADAGTLVFDAAVSVFGGEDGTLKDSDWEDIENPDLRTTYSDSDTELTGIEGDVAAAIRLAGGGTREEGFGLAAGAGFLLQHWEWEGSDTRQSEVGSPLGFFFPGKTIEYEGDLEMPYLHLRGHLNLASLRMTGRVGYSPWVTATDEDNHLLRGIKSEADTEGDGFFAEAGLDIPISDLWGFFASANLLWLETEGDSRNQVYEADPADELAAGDTWVIEQEIESLQLGFTAGVRFSL